MYRQHHSLYLSFVLICFFSKLKVVGITDELLFVIRPLERPETKAQIDGPLLGSKNKFQPDIIINAVLNVFTSTIFDLNFNESHNKYHDFPRLATTESTKTSLTTDYKVCIIKVHIFQLIKYLFVWGKKFSQM